MTFDIWDTAGCSCEQIIDEQESGQWTHQVRLQYR